MNKGIKPVGYGPPNAKFKPPHHSSGAPIQTPRHPCTLCTAKGFQSDHFPLNLNCGVAKLSSPDILKLISNNKVCPSCTHTHDPAYRCRLPFHTGASKVCPKGCKHDGLPVHHRACMHSNQTPTASISKVGFDRFIPLVDNILLGAFSLGIQYNTGCQLSLISQSALQALPTSMYSRGTSSRVRVITYAGEGKIILTTKIKLKLHSKMLKLSAMEEDFNNGSGFSFPVPPKWRSFTGTLTSSHYGQISILLGGDNHLFFPKEMERDPQGVALYLSNLTQNYLVYGSVPPNTIKEPLISTTVNTVFIKALTIHDLQDQLGLTVSAEDFTDPTTCGKLIQLTKERGIQAIMENTSVDILNHQVSVKYLYKENLVELGENYHQENQDTAQQDH